MNAVVGHRVRGLARADHGLVSWVGWSRGLGERTGPVAVDLWGDAARFGLVPCRDGEVYGAATVREDRFDMARPWRSIVGAAMPDADGLVHAAHAGLPTTGQGASEAMRDAEVLAAVLPQGADREPLQRGLARYAAAREVDACAAVRAARAVSSRIFGHTGHAA